MSLIPQFNKYWYQNFESYFEWIVEGLKKTDTLGAQQKVHHSLHVKRDALVG